MIRPPTTEQRIIAYAKAGKSPAEIANLTGRTISTVYHYTCKARRAGFHIPKAHGGARAVDGETVIALKAATAKALHPEAADRGMSLNQFCNALLAAISEDDLEEAILGDGGKADA
jgi:transposase